MRSALLVMFLAIGCTKSTQPIANTASTQCGGLVWPTKLDKPSTPASHREAAMRVIEASGMRAAYGEMLEISLKSALQVNPQLAQFEAGFREFFAKYASYDAIVGDFAELYMRVFGELQLRQIEAFYRTPTGMLAVKELAKIMQEGSKIGERKVAEHQHELIQILTKSQQQGQGPSPLAPKP
ncbi:MAG TPA: DUF2059 domain-containing protein [Kofleriaceae bacterium]|nr:DUF2059 domain-containing protein [Kofleriaceae bacterium]